jgi:citronellol/citronellal dehydrogenase
MAKYGMSECTLGHAGEFRPFGIGVNSLWPRTPIVTAALQMIPGLDLDMCRKPEIVADAAWYILTGDAKSISGRFFIDDEVLREHGVTDLDRYSVKPGQTNFLPDFFLD